MNQIGQRRERESYGMMNGTLEKMKERCDE